MRTRGFVVTLFAVAFAFAPQSFRTAFAARRAHNYRAELISPRAEEVLAHLDRLSATNGLALYSRSTMEHPPASRKGQRNAGTCS